MLSLRGTSRDYIAVVYYDTVIGAKLSCSLKADCKKSSCDLGGCYQGSRKLQCHGRIFKFLDLVYHK